MSTVQRANSGVRLQSCSPRYHPPERPSLPRCHCGMSEPRRRHFRPFVRTKSGAPALVRLSGVLGEGTRKVPEDGDGMSCTITTRSAGDMTPPTLMNKHQRMQFSNARRQPAQPLYECVPCPRGTWGCHCRLGHGACIVDEQGRSWCRHRPLKDDSPLLALLLRWCGDERKRLDSRRLLTSWPRWNLMADDRPPPHSRASLHYATLSISQQHQGHTIPGFW